MDKRVIIAVQIFLGLLVGISYFLLYLTSYKVFDVIYLKLFNSLRFSGTVIIILYFVLAVIVSLVFFLKFKYKPFAVTYLISSIATSLLYMLLLYLTVKKMGPRF
ncbi:MAG: hypothetical protein APF81_05400 [Desulfosporosinus sp. BRH_c37]|nr:MAG: hypothetical protein APF81_05400 [Desulfosporosinus sp. BRH_c37]